MNVFNKILLVGALLSFAHGIFAGQPNCGDDREALIIASDFSGPLGFPPFEFLVGQGPEEELVGFDASVACEISHRLGFKTENFLQTPFETLLEEMRSDNPPFQIALSAISITNPRLTAANAGFVKYNDDALGILLSEAFINAQNEQTQAALRNPETVLATLNNLGVNIATTQATRQIDILADSYDNVTNFDTFVNVTAGRIAVLQNANGIIGLFTDGPTAVALAEGEDALFGLNNITAIVGNDTASQGLGIWVSSQCCQLYADIAQAIKDMEEDGTLARLREEFNVGTFTPVDLTPEACAGVTADILSNNLSNFIFTKYCGCG